MADHKTQMSRLLHIMKKSVVRTYLILFIIFAYRSGTYGQPDMKLDQTKITDDLYFKKIQDSIYMIIHYFPTGANSLFVLLPGHLGVIIDTPYETTGTESLLDWIDKNFGTLKLTAIITGFHQDNLGGNEVLFSKNIPVYGADLTVKLLKEKGKGLMDTILNSVANLDNKKYYNSYKSLNLLPPDKTFPIKEGLKLVIGNETFEVYFPGESHTIDNTVVYLQHHKILFGGCMIKGLNFNYPGYIAYANMKEWPLSVEKVMNRFQDCNLIIPGHGKEGGKEILPHMIKILNDWNKEHPD